MCLGSELFLALLPECASPVSSSKAVTTKVIVRSLLITVWIFLPPSFLTLDRKKSSFCISFLYLTLMAKPNSLQGRGKSTKPQEQNLQLALSLWVYPRNHRSVFIQAWSVSVPTFLRCPPLLPFSWTFIFSVVQGRTLPGHRQEVNGRRQQLLYLNFRHSSYGFAPWQSFSTRGHQRQQLQLECPSVWLLFFCPRNTVTPSPTLSISAGTSSVCSRAVIPSSCCFCSSCTGWHLFRVLKSKFGKRVFPHVQP